MDGELAGWRDAQDAHLLESLLTLYCFFSYSCHGSGFLRDQLRGGQTEVKG